MHHSDIYSQYIFDKHILAMCILLYAIAYLRNTIAIGHAYPTFDA
jgi:hypothetical protein